MPPIFIFQEELIQYQYNFIQLLKQTIWSKLEVKNAGIIC